MDDKQKTFTKVTFTRGQFKLANIYLFIIFTQFHQINLSSSSDEVSLTLAEGVVGVALKKSIQL